MAFVCLAAMLSLVVPADADQTSGLRVIELGRARAAPERIDLSVGSAVVLKLFRAGGTAYWWQVESTVPRLVRVTELPFEAEQRDSENPIVGVPEADRFKVEGLGRGEAGIAFKLAAADGDVAETVKIKLVISDP